MSDYFDLGSYTRPVTTGSAAAQTWFTRGLLWAYGFNHEEAIACFERAAEADPGCVMAYWGLAYALGPNYNKPWEAFAAEEVSASVSRACAALAAAAGRGQGAAPVERAQAGALASS
jgi:tetratricopeptide (TPR) repeat protein